MYYRRKVLLALLENFGGQLNGINLQKTLFLFSKLQAKPVYDFIPYKYGCYSYQAVWDLGALQIRSCVEKVDNDWKLIGNSDYLGKLTKQDIDIIRHLKRLIQGLTTEELIRKTYLEYPFWAINSLKAKEILSSKQYQVIQNSKPQRNNTSLFTIGYEGISLEKYINKLIINDVKVLCDVRRNPFSQKFGFSRTTLIKVCEAVGISYMHFPELGIPSEKRQHLHNQADYDALFDDYTTSHLINQQSAINHIFELLIDSRRIALTCFEASHCQCHRSKVADAIVRHADWRYELIHL